MMCIKDVPMPIFLSYRGVKSVRASRKPRAFHGAFFQGKRQLYMYDIAFGNLEVTGVPESKRGTNGCGHLGRE